HSSIGFVARHAMIAKVRGTFNEYEGTGYFDADNPENSRVRVVIQADSIDTRNADRDAHLRSNDFFDMANYPQIIFESTAIERVDDTTYRVTGDLTVKDVTKPITFDVEVAGTAVDPFGNFRLGLEGRAVVNLKDWGLTWNAPLEAGGVLVGDNVTLRSAGSSVRPGARAC